MDGVTKQDTHHITILVGTDLGRWHISVLVAIVMEQEAKPFIEHLGLTLQQGFFPAHTPFLAYTSSDDEKDGCRVTVVTFGKDQIYGTGVDLSLIHI